MHFGSFGGLPSVLIMFLCVFASSVTKQAELNFLLSEEFRNSSIPVTTIPFYALLNLCADTPEYLLNNSKDFYRVQAVFDNVPDISH